MESDDEILGISPRGRYNTFDHQKQHRLLDHSSYRNTLSMSDLPQRSRSMMNLSSGPLHKKHSWLLPESPTVNEKQVQLTKRKGLSGALSPPPPKTPNVSRYLEVFSRLKKAYSGFVKACQDYDPSSLTPKERLHFEKCTKKLESKLQKIQDLHELYVHQEHMREGADNLLKTIERETSKKIKSGADYCKINLKKNLTRLCAVEDEINNMTGSIKIEVIGLIGFARLSSGDVYSVQFKHGSEKLTSKCKVVGQGQKWTNSNVNIKLNAANDLVLKVNEVRKVNSNSIGVVTCPVANFLSAEGQEFVLPVNSTGSLKLRIAAFWSPFSIKEWIFMENKFDFHDSPMRRLDSLSDGSVTSSPCSTPKSGTLSSMPTVITSNSVPAPMKISVNGAIISPQASVIKHSRIDRAKLDFTDRTFLTDGDLASRTMSLPDIAKTAETDNIRFGGSETDSCHSASINNNSPKLGFKHAASCDQLNDNIILRDSISRGQKQPRPITLGPTFSNGFSSQSDYENVVNLITTSIFGDKPDIIPETESSKPKKKQRPKSVATPFKPVPIPDYPIHLSLRSSSASTANRPMPIITEPDYSPPPVEEPKPKCFITEMNDSEKTLQKYDVTLITNSEKGQEKHDAKELTDSKKVETEVLKTEEVAVNSYSNGSLPIGLSSKKLDNEKKSNDETNVPQNENDMDIEDNIENDEILPELRAILLDISIRLNSNLEAWSERTATLRNIVNEVLNLIKEKKKPISRTASIENALNSIDSAFDFLSEHQTLKREKSVEVGDKRIHPSNWRLLKKALFHHVKAGQTLCKKLEDLKSPLKIKEENCMSNILKETEILEAIVGILTTIDSTSPSSASMHLDNTGQAGKFWECHCSKNEFDCTSEQMKLSLEEVFQEASPGTVSKVILERIQDKETYQVDPDEITVFQFASFLLRHGDLSSYYQTVRKEERVVKVLQQQDDLLVMSMMHDRKSIPIVPRCLKLIALKLKSNNRTIQRVIVEFLTKLPMQTKDEAIKMYSDLLEDDDEQTRESACNALKYLEASKSQDAIAYLWQNDSENVKKAALDALKIVGFPPGLEPKNTENNMRYSEVATRL